MIFSRQVFIHADPVRDGHLELGGGEGQGHGVQPRGKCCTQTLTMATFTLNRRFTSIFCRARLYTRTFNHSICILRSTVLELLQSHVAHTLRKLTS